MDRVTSSLAGLYDYFVTVWERVDKTVPEWINACLATPPGQTFVNGLDIGCGTGHSAEQLAQFCREVDAIDTNPHMVEVARRRGQGKPIGYGQGDVLDLTSKPGGSYDVVLSTFTLHKVGVPWIVLPHVASLVRPGGIAILVDDIDTDGNWANPEFHKLRGAKMAREVERVTNDIMAARIVHNFWERPDWLQMITRDIPMRRQAALLSYQTWFPGCALYDFGRTALGVLWHRPAAEPGGDDEPTELHSATQVEHDGPHRHGIVMDMHGPPYDPGI